MATGMSSNRCSKCQKGAGMCNCTGCKAFFCVKHFTDHRQELMDRFDNDVGVELNKLLEQIGSLNPSSTFCADYFCQVDRWEIETIEKVHKAAAEVRRQLTVLTSRKQNKLTDKFKVLKEEIHQRRGDEDFVEHDIKRLKEEIDQVQRSLKELTQPNKTKTLVIQKYEVDWNRLIYVEETTSSSIIAISMNTKWARRGVTVAGGNGVGNGLNQLNNPTGLYVDDDQTLYIADCDNDRIMEWKHGVTSGKVVAGGNGRGDRTDQLNSPTGLIIDKQTDSFIICEYGNRRVMRWPRQNCTNGQTIISNIKCVGVTMDSNGSLYISDVEEHEVRRWRVNETKGEVVAGGNGEGGRFNQLYGPNYIFVDRNHSLYVTDCGNDRVMKWIKGATEGIVVAGGQGRGSELAQLAAPRGVVVDQSGTVYVADCLNHRIMRWPKGATQGSIVVGGNGEGQQPEQISLPRVFTFDHQGNLYVVDNGNCRVQKFAIGHHS